MRASSHTILDDEADEYEYEEEFANYSKLRTELLDAAEKYIERYVDAPAWFTQIGWSEPEKYKRRTNKQTEPPSKGLVHYLFRIVHI